MSKIITLTILSLTLLSAENLSLTYRGTLSNHELLDVYIDGNWAYVPAGLGGLNIVDLSAPGNPEVIGQYDADGCAWGRLYAWATRGTYAYGTGRDCGIHIVSVSPEGIPTFMNTYIDQSRASVRYEHPETSNDLLFASRHQDGVEILSLSDPIHPYQLSVIPTGNAWATLASDSILYIADGGYGIAVVDITDPETPIILSTMETSGTAKDLALVNQSLFVAVGAYGVDMINVQNPATPEFIANYNTTGYASRVAANDSLVAVSDWDDVEVLRHGTFGLALAGYKNTGGRVMAINMIGDHIISAEWNLFSVFRFENQTGADMDLSVHKLSFPRTASPSTSTLPLQMNNSGNSVLSIAGYQISNSDFSITIPQLSLNPGQSQEIAVHYTPQGGTWYGTLTFHTNDPDEETVDVRVTGNFPYGPMVGDPAPGFSLPLVNGNGYMGLEDLAGQPAVIAFFTGW